MIVVKAMVGAVCNPLLIGFVLAAAGLFRWRLRRRGAAWLLGAGITFSYLASTSMIGDLLLAPLEHQYPAFDPSQDPGVRDIVVLGSGYEPQDRAPVTGALDPAGLARIVEGVRLALARPESRLLVSGGALPGFSSSAVGYAKLAEQLGVSSSAITIMDRALDTHQEAQDVAAALGRSQFVLVTSAFHMPRAMRLMQRAGANPVAAPTGQLVHPKLMAERFGLFPGSSGLRKTEAALHEYLGIAALSLRLD